MPKVSVLMPVYNTPENWLREAIESILNQTFTDFEFLILDDGSTNNVKEVVKSYSDKRIKYFHKENSGISETLNLGLEHAKGEYIARMDSDDISLPERFAKQVAYMDEHPEVGVLGTGFEMFGNKSRQVLKAKEIGYIDMMKANAIANPTSMVRKNVMQKYDLGYKTAEDYELWSRLVKITKIENLQEILLKYRWSGKNISITCHDNQLQMTDVVKQNMLNFLTSDVSLQKEIMNLAGNLTSRKKVKLFGFLPLFLIKTKNGKSTWYLFHFIPVCKTRG